MADAIVEVAARAQPDSADRLLGAVRDLLPRFRDRAAEAEQKRHLPTASAEEMIAAGLARALVPRRWGGTELDLETWFDIVLEVSSADASHGWCANLLMHHAHQLAAFPEEAQMDVWKAGPDVPLAGSVLPSCHVSVVDGGYRVTGKAAFASGLRHSSWVWVGGMVPAETGPIWTLFLIPPDEYGELETWNVSGMCGTGSNTIVTEDVFVPTSHTVPFHDIVLGRSAGAAIHEDPMYRLPFASYAQAGFAGVMLGAARGGADFFRDWTAERKTHSGSPMAEVLELQLEMGRANADLDAAEMLLRRGLAAAAEPDATELEVRARTLRDAARSAELVVGAIDRLIGLTGTSGYAVSNPMQRAWRDIHFASCHTALNPQNSIGYWSGVRFGLERPPGLLVY